MADIWQLSYAFFIENSADRFDIRVGTEPDAKDKVGMFNTAMLDMSEAEREERMREVREEATMRGLKIVSERRVHNPQFDAPNEKTTYRVFVRPCINEEEASEVVWKLADVLDRRGLEKPDDAQLVTGEELPT